MGQSFNTYGSIGFYTLIDEIHKLDLLRQCGTPEEIRLRFNIPNDFTPEEEEEVRKFNPWCENL